MDDDVLLPLNRAARTNRPLSPRCHNRHECVHCYGVVPAVSVAPTHLFTRPEFVGMEDKSPVIEQHTRTPMCVCIRNTVKCYVQHRSPYSIQRA